jgi:hypothetical protein
MDDFGLDRPELSGTLISLEFAPGGRIGQLWAADPELPEENEEFQLVLGPVHFGGEFSDDYLPGTILLGARTNPDEPWVLSRNASVTRPVDEELEGFGDVRFGYEMRLLEELTTTGRYVEIPGNIPQIEWEVAIRNDGKSSIEIGELAFPMAFNNFYHGFGRSEADMRKLFQDRVYVHKFIGGAASYMFAQRLNGTQPGLLVYPARETGWEFYSSVPASLKTHFRWEGIPVVYVHSRAAVEREGQGEWFNEHTSLILEPGDTRTYHTRFAVTDGTRPDGPLQTLTELGRPTIKLLPAAVAPADVGVAVEIAGCTPTWFLSDRDADVATDADEEGGFCFVKPTEPGPARISFEDNQGRVSHTHLFFTDPIEDLIKARADHIVRKQVIEQQGLLQHAIAQVDLGTGRLLTDIGEFVIDWSLADALFLAEKNSLFPVRSEIEVLERYVHDFIRAKVQNPGDGMVGSVLSDTAGCAVAFADPTLYPLMVGLYHAMAKIARVVGNLRWSTEQYLAEASRTALSLLRRALPLEWRSMGLKEFTTLYDLMADFEQHGYDDWRAELEAALEIRAEELLDGSFHFAGMEGWATAGFEESVASGRFLQNEDATELAIRCAFAARSLSPSWWWYGSDKGFTKPDAGESCLGNTSVSTSVIFFDALDRDYGILPEGQMRLAFGGMLGVWALVRSDGAASSGFCPDAASRLYGYHARTGGIGRALFQYLRNVGSYVLPSGTGSFTFGCHFEAEEGEYVVRPWEGVGRKVVLRQISAEFELSFGKIVELRLDAGKRWARLTIENPWTEEAEVQLRVRGLWGEKLESSGKIIDCLEGEATVPVLLVSGQPTHVEVKVR